MSLETRFDQSHRTEFHNVSFNIQRRGSQSILLDFAYHSMPKSVAPICAVITEETVEAARLAINQAASEADLIELRLDYLKDFDFSDSQNLRPLLEDKRLPVIITCRAVEEGGKQQIPDSVRLRLLVEGARLMADYCDIEAAHYEDATKLNPDISKLVISYHNFDETPACLESVYENICALPAAVHKIATRANSVTDTLEIFRLIDRAKRENRNLIALAMNEPGLITRILGPSRGSFLTYATVRRRAESAPGQLTCQELRRLYRIGNISRDTTMAAVIGNPVSHSASPAMHNAAFQSLGLDWVYLPIEVGDVADFFKRMVSTASREIDLNLCGLSVTLPHKTSVIDLCDEIDITAQRIGAVNTVVVEAGRLKGYNTDAQGAIEPLMKIRPLEGESCAVVGAGGAARAVIYGLVEQRARVTLFARNVEKAQSLGHSFGVPVLSVDQLYSSDAQIVINTTPVGMRGHSENESPVTRAALAGRRVAYDLVYNPLDTCFLKYARAEGCQTISGIDMLVAQARLQFELWTGEKPPVDLIRTAAIEKVGASLL